MNPKHLITWALTVIVMFSVLWAIKATKDYHDAVAVAEQLTREAEIARAHSDSLVSVNDALVAQVQEMANAFYQTQLQYLEDLTHLESDEANARATASRIEDQLRRDLTASNAALLDSLVAQHDLEVLSLQGQLGLSQRRLGEAVYLLQQTEMALASSMNTISSQITTINQQADAIAAYEAASRQGFIAKAFDNLTSPLGIGVVAVGAAALVILR